MAKGRIIIVDDQEGIRESMAGILEMEGYDVRTFDNGYNAIDKAKEQTVDIAFLDVKMPVINGVDTYLGLKKVSPETAVFMMTAYAEEELVRKALEEGAYACIHKPFEMDRVIDIVEKTHRKPVILLVDADKLERRRVRDGLVAKGHRVAAAASIEEAVYVLGRAGVGAALLDAGMEQGAAELLQAGVPAQKLLLLGAGSGGGVSVRRPVDVDDLQQALAVMLKQ